MANVLVVAEHVDGVLRKVTRSAVTFAREAAELTGGDVIALVLGDGTDAIADEVASLQGVDRVLYDDNPAFADYLAENYAPAIEAAANEVDATIVSAAGSTQGRDLMPRVAAALDAGQISETIDIFEDDGIKYRRPLWADNVITTVESTTPDTVVTVRTTDFGAADDADDAAEIVDFDAGVEPADDAEFVVFDKVESERPELTDAEVVISGGRGLKSEENFEMIKQLADIFGGAVGASRAAVDSGYAPNDWQIGQTGKVVAPKLYFAIAISGAIQHLAGMKGSKNIVAINTDPEAPIFEVCDYGLVMDAFEAVPELNEKLPKHID